MPELPEVETVCRGLRQAVLGRRIEKVALLRTVLRIPVPPDFVSHIEGKEITEIQRRAKYILIFLNNNYVIVAHLGMSGHMRVFSPLSETREKHDHMVFFLSDGQAIIFNDARRFGLVTGCFTTELAVHPLLAGLGPEPLSAHFTPSYMFAQCQKRKQSIKPLLMDQKIVVGVGNIYAAEALHLSRINPERSANKMSFKECGDLISAVRVVLNAAIDSGGSTLRDYVNSVGSPGYFQHRFEVYDREGQPCRSCMNPIMRITQAGRSTFYCAECQRII